ncbi:MAG: hypothetical protein AB7G28_13945 [Pirellulales bacterium]
MSIRRLPTGRFEACVRFDARRPVYFEYSTRHEAQELVDAETIFLLLHHSGSKFACLNGQIHAAADALLRAPCNQDPELLHWTLVKSRWIRSWSQEAAIYAESPADSPDHTDAATV